MAIPENEWLESVYTQLGYVKGELYPAAYAPGDSTLSVWTDKGDWLVIAEKVGGGLKGAKIDKVFFVGNNPTIVFGQCIDDERVLKRLFQRAWCMARPSLLFLAFPGELRVYSLNSMPQRDNKGWKAPTPLERVRSINEVYERLKVFRREEIETGRFFRSDSVRRIEGRADIQLIRDLKVVRAELMKLGLTDDKLKYAHSLIGRSIFIRYLEDRGILNEEYFRRVAGNNDTWNHLIDSTLDGNIVDQETKEPFYLRVLGDKEFTYALWDQLSADFNGDMFPQDHNERNIVTGEHLKLMQRFMLGDTEPQMKLFLWAYKFDIIPIELISSIYEEFYHKESGLDRKTKGTFYTPSALVEFVLSRVLTEDVLSRKPRIIDPACGSGIFLVESFRRIVRYRVKQQKGLRLEPDELKAILRKQIAGIEINEEAVRVAAFSLCLAFLDHLETPDILEQVRLGKRLPLLKVHPYEAASDDQLNILLEAHAFNVTAKIYNTELVQLFGAQCADVVVGNPPWGRVDTGAEIWCRKNDRPLGDKEYSQAFIWRTLELLKEGGVAGLLVPSGVLFKQNPTSQLMRSQWLEEAELIQVVNFAHVREVFFTGGNSPFAYVEFRKNRKFDSEVYVQYWSAKRTAAVDGQQAVVLSRPDVHVIKQSSLKDNPVLWKVYWWGGHRDAALIQVLSLYPKLGQIIKSKGWPRGYGFQGPTREGPNIDSEIIQNYLELPTQKFTRYGSIDSNLLVPPPDKVYRKGNPQLYEGWRILIKRGVGANGVIMARLDNLPFCFRHSIFGINVSNARDWERKVIVGILWSSLARYYLFYSSASWGIWHDSIHLADDVLNFPIVFPKEPALRSRIVQVVDHLRSLDRGDSGFLVNVNIFSALEQQLDDLIFDLYQMSEPERDLVRDFCEVELEFLYNKSRSKSSQPLDGPRQQQGLHRDLPRLRHQQEGLEGYLEAFLDAWNKEFDQEGELWWRVIGLKSKSPMVAVIFSTKGKTEDIPSINLSDEEQWAFVLRQLSQNVLSPYKTDQVYIDGMVRYVSDRSILIVKRNERRLWIRSKALEDAEATMLQAMHLQRRSYQ